MILFLVSKYLPLYSYIPFSHSSIDGYLDCFQFLPIMIRTAINMDQVSL